LRIAVVIERIEVWRGGAETSTMELSRLLTERGHEVHFITTTNSQSLPDITVHTLPRPAVMRSRRTAAFARHAAAFLKKHDFDIVHAISPLLGADVYQPRGGLLAETMARNVATRSTASRRLFKRAMLAMNVKQRALLELERGIFQPDGPIIACVSDYVARQCATFYEVRPPRTRVVFNGVNIPHLEAQEHLRQRSELRREYGIAEDTLLLLFIAHNFRLKGLHPLIETVSRLSVSGFHPFHLLVVGRDNIVPFQRRLNALGLNRYVTIHRSDTPIQLVFSWCRRVCPSNLLRSVQPGRAGGPVGRPSDDHHCLQRRVRDHEGRPARIHHRNARRCRTVGPAHRGTGFTRASRKNVGQRQSPA